MKLTTRQSRLEHIARIHRAIARRTRSNNSMKLIDEQNNLTIRLLNFTKNRLQSVLEFTAVLSTSQHRRQVKRNQLTILQARRNITCNNTLGQTFNDCRFTSARFTNQYRVILCTTRKDLNGTTDFFRTTNNRIEFSFTSSLSKVVAILL